MLLLKRLDFKKVFVLLSKIPLPEEFLLMKLRPFDYYSQCFCREISLE